MERLCKIMKDKYGEEPIHDVEVWVDGDIAVAWTPYDVNFADNVKLSVGTDITMLARVGGEWKISGLVDTARLVDESGKVPPRYSGPEMQDKEEEKAVLGVCQRVVDTFRNDTLEELLELNLQGLVWAMYRVDHVEFRTVEEFIELAKPIIRGHDILEVLEEPVVRIDRNLALVWSPFKCYIDGKLDHYGSDMLLLGKIAGKWMIIGSGDNNNDAEGKA